MKNGERPALEWTLARCKEWLRQRFDKGETCPCCHQLVKLYKRPMTGAMAHALILMSRYPDPNEFFHVPSWLARFTASATIRGGDWAKLKLWGLIEPKPQAVRDDGSRRSGYWRITRAGVDFVRRRSRLPKYVYTYNQNKVPRVHGDERLVDVCDVLGKKFDYARLMQATPDRSLDLL